MNSQFQIDYNTLKNSYVSDIELPSAYLYSSILANGHYSENISYYQKMYLLGIINREKIAPEDSMKMPAKVTKEIIDRLDERYNITELQVIYTDLNGVYEMIIDGKNSISVEKLI